jgi:hypothetical protein
MGLRTNHATLCPEIGKYLVDLVHSEALFALLQLTQKPEPHTGPNRQFRLSDVLFLAASLYKITDLLHFYTLSGTNLQNNQTVNKRIGCKLRNNSHTIGA